MQVFGNLDFLGKGKLVRPVLENGDFPANPTPGEFMLKDKKLYVCVELQGDLPYWVQLTQEINTYRHDQTVAALEWSIQHDLNTNIGLVQVYDANGKQIIPEDIDCSNQNVTTVTFPVPTAGVAMFMVGDSLGGVQPNTAYTQNFSNLSTWIVTHNLGYNPLITCVVNGYVVQPQSILHDSTMQTTITFSAAQTGSVRCV